MNARVNAATTAVRAAMESDTQFGAVVPPLHLSSNFTFEGVGRPRQFDYSRSGNPTRQALADRSAAPAPVDEPEAAPLSEEVRAYRDAHAAWRADQHQQCVDKFGAFLQAYPESDEADDAIRREAATPLAQLLDGPRGLQREASSRAPRSSRTDAPVPGTTNSGSTSAQGARTKRRCAKV